MKILGSKLRNYLEKVWVVALLCVLCVLIAGCGRAAAGSDFPAVVAPTPSEKRTPTVPPATPQPMRVVQTPEVPALQQTFVARMQEVGIIDDATLERERMLGPTLDAQKDAMTRSIYGDDDPSNEQPEELTPRAFIVSPTPLLAPTSTVVTGLSCDCHESFPHRLKATNCWIDLVGDEYLTVFAGASKPDNAQGIIIIWTTTQDQISSSQPVFYSTPSKHGAVTITTIELDTVDDHHLHLTAEDGTLFVFDLISRTWENPTATPTP